MSFTPSEEEEVYGLVEEITGSCQKGKYRREVLLTNILRRMEAHDSKRFEDYLKLARANSEEWKEFLSAITIHTTSWFREMPHYEHIRTWIDTHERDFLTDPFLIWSSACSTGEELYSIGLEMERYRLENPGFDYRLLGTDIDPVSVAIGNRAIYSAKHLSAVPNACLPGVMVGSGKTDGLMTLDKEIRCRASFKVWNLSDGTFEHTKAKFDLIFCRNVLIYFSPEKVATIVRNLADGLKMQGLLVLGHSEALEKAPTDFLFVGNSMYEKASPRKALSETAGTQQKILVVDDSVSVRKVLSKLFLKNGFEVVEASNPLEATQATQKYRISAVTLDLNMGRPTDGSEWLKEARARGFKEPVVVITDARVEDAHHVLGTLESGAQDYVVKSVLANHPDDVVARMRDLIVSHTQHQYAGPSNGNFLHEFEMVRPEVFVLGASTGGPEALAQILRDFSKIPVEFIPPVVVVQHISPEFAPALAQRMESVSGLKLATGSTGEVLVPGKLYMSQSDAHIGLRREGGRLASFFTQEGKINGHRPAVDFLFRTTADTSARTMAVLLTGMGRDGAAGMLDLLKKGRSINLAQNEASSVVYGMPKEAVTLNAVHFTGNIKQLRAMMERSIKMKELAGKKAA